MLNTLKLLIVLLFFSPMAFAENLPTMHQIYQTAESGKLSDAQRMIEQVLQVHPDSGKAHYVNAELLAKEGNFAQARTELETAERLSPGLAFAKPQAVQNLKQRVAVSSTNIVPGNSLTQAGPASANHFPWAKLIFGVLVVLLLMWGVKAFLSRRSRVNPSMMNGNHPVAGYTPGGPGGPGAGNPNGYSGGPATPGQAGGMGSGIMSGLATGAAVGVGMVAGEALMHRFTDSSNANAATNNGGNIAPDNNVQQQDDMGGSDFGVNDTSWDDNSSDLSDDSW